MLKRPIKYRGRELCVSRQLPQLYFLSHTITCGLKVILDADCSTDESIGNIESYFSQYGLINYRECLNQQVFLIFDE
jgi:hypothetical protein